MGMWSLLIAACSDGGRELVVPSLSAGSLYPASFSAAQTDYVVRCDADTVRVDGIHVSNLSILGGSLQSLSETSHEVTLQQNRSFEFRWNGTTYSVRCLPSGFPRITVSAPGGPGQQLYAADFPLGGPQERAVIFDAVGTPVWWRTFGSNPRAFKVLADGRFLALNNSPNCSPSPGNFSFCATVRWYDPATGIETVVFNSQLALDLHDVQLTPSGTYLALRYVARDCSQPASNCMLQDTGLPANSIIVDAEVVEFDPTSGAVLFLWSSRTENLERFFVPRWLTYSALADLGLIPFIRGEDQVTYPDGTAAHDLLHINSVDLLGDKLLVSIRHLDSVLQISRSTGLVEWKLGGIHWPGRSLALRDGPVLPGADALTLLGGQHDARYLSPTEITVYDNGSGQSRGGRALKIDIDLASGALVREMVVPPSPIKSVCCGSARRESESWVVSWGGSNTVGVYRPDGAVQLQMSVDLSTAPGSIGFSYQFLPVREGFLSKAVLRADMNR
jgi:hypothetical protein